MEHHKHPERFWAHVLTMPFIYALAVPLILFDISIEIYHRICFPAYGTPYVKRSEYIRFDRSKLKYLSLQDKFNCDYCAYANGLMRYAARIANETEKYWCGVKHEKADGFISPNYQKDFLEFGDKAGYDKVKENEKIG